MTKHSESTQNATCDNNMLANRLLKFRVYYELDDELRFWHIEFKQEEKRISIPQVSTNGKILGISQFSGLSNRINGEIYEGDVYEYNFTLDGTRKIKGKVYFDKEVGAWYLGHYLLSTVLHEQENDNWKKQNNFNFKENQYLRYLGNIFFNPELSQTTS